MQDYKKLLCTLTIFTTCLFSFAQEETNQNILNQFEEVYSSSSTYQDYKVIKINKYNQLKNNVVDSLTTLQSSLSSKNTIIAKNQQQISALQKKLSSLESRLTSAQQNRDNRSVFGIPVNKSTFTIILIISHTILIALVLFFAYKYKGNAGTTKNAINNLKHLEDEFENHKKNSLKRYQEVNRKLQDELNKQWKKDNKS
ncbi:hypothetical protein [Ochrovirga pacifica]|uniref:hypothetical protein n=1 Tax=Ochrovirga pacifica TaxID=1042376 RepID=UPI00025591AD|nr:hypothetical protein [Ochrovirga pacifica]